MYDKTLIIDMLQQVEDMLNTLVSGIKNVSKLDDLLTSPEGVLQLNGICMCLLVVGEELKKIDQRTNKQLLSQYPNIPWREVMGMRDKIAHHYFEIDVDIVSDIIYSDIPPLIVTIQQIIKDLTKNIDMEIS